MKEFMDKVGRILKECEERLANPDREILIRPNSGNYRPTIFEAKQHSTEALAHNRCEICDWSFSTPSISRKDSGLAKPNYVTPDRVSGRMLCNVCRGESSLLSAKQILHRLEEALDNHTEEGHDVNDKEPVSTYLDTFNGVPVKVRVFKTSHPKLRSRLTEQEKETWRSEYSKSLGPRHPLSSL